MLAKTGTFDELPIGSPIWASWYGDLHPALLEHVTTNAVTVRFRWGLHTMAREEVRWAIATA